MFPYTITRKYTLFAVLMLVVITQTLAAPRPINYQGYLAQPDGTPIDASISVVVEIWTAATAGTLLYSESHATVTVSKGRFSIEISTGSPISGTFDADQFQQDTWLALTINGELLNPRSRLGAVAGSQHAEIAERLSTSCADGEWLGFRGGQLDCYECQVPSSTSCYDGPSGTQGVGECISGTTNCVEGAFSSVCNAQVLPAAESCNSKDDDCNGLVDDGTSLPGCINLFIDADGDGVGDTTTAGCFCNSEPNTSTISGDCNDTDNEIFPGQPLFFSELNSEGTFDYNCNSVIEKKFNQPLASCTFDGSGCVHVFGFVGTIPNCGEVGVQSDSCSQSGSVCTVVPQSNPLTQRCR